MSIKEIRLRTGLSQSQFARKFHLRLNTLQTWEQGIRNIPKPTLFMIERILELEAVLNENNKQLCSRD